jgi:hypothetical protein
MMGVGIIMPVTRGRLFAQLIGDNLAGTVNRPETAIILT